MKIGIFGYGNLGKGVEIAAQKSQDIQTVGIFTRRSPDKISSPFNTPVFKAENVYDFCDKTDVLIICGGSANDLPVLTPELAKCFNVVDSFDNHSMIYEHFNLVNSVSLEAKKTALISAGWDPGLFSLARLYFEAVMPNGITNTFWGKGISQGHSQVIKTIDGVKNAKQYTVPVKRAIKIAKSTNAVKIPVQKAHKRLCFVVPDKTTDKNKIKENIVNIPQYFKEYNTRVRFISENRMIKKHSAFPHGGTVVRSGFTGIDSENTAKTEFSLSVNSNPEFTGSILLAFARAVYKMSQMEDFGCKTVFDIAPGDIVLTKREELLKNYL